MVIPPSFRIPFEGINQPPWTWESPSIPMGKQSMAEHHELGSAVGKKLGEIPSLLMKSPSFPMDVLFLSFPVCFPSPSISPVFPWIFALKLMGFSMPSTTVTAGPYSWPRHCVRTAGKPTPPRSGTPRRTEIWRTCRLHSPASWCFTQRKHDLSG